MRRETDITTAILGIDRAFSWAMTLAAMLLMLGSAASADSGGGWPASGAYEPAPVTLMIAHGPGATPVIETGKVIPIPAAPVAAPDGSQPPPLPIYVINVTVAPRFEFRSNGCMRVTLDDTRVTSTVVREQDPQSSDPTYTQWEADIASLAPARTHITRICAYFDNAEVIGYPRGAYTTDILVPVGASSLKRLEVDYQWLDQKATFGFGDPAPTPGITPMALATPLIVFALFQAFLLQRKRIFNATKA